jgi:hypothetical protein
MVLGRYRDIILDPAVTCLYRTRYVKHWYIYHTIELLRYVLFRDWGFPTITKL